MPGCATLVFAREFDAALAKLPIQKQRLIVDKINSMGLALDSFPHYRMTGWEEYRLRIGDYRVIYDFNRTKNEIYLITLGHRIEVYR